MLGKSTPQRSISASRKATAVGVALAVRAELPNDTNFGLFVGIPACGGSIPVPPRVRIAKQCRRRDGSERQSWSPRKRPCRPCRCHQQNCNLFGNSAAATHAVWRHSNLPLTLPGNWQDGTWVSPAKSLIFAAAARFPRSKRARGSESDATQGKDRNPEPIQECGIFEPRVAHSDRFASILPQGVAAVISYCRIRPWQAYDGPVVPSRHPSSHLGKRAGCLNRSYRGLGVKTHLPESKEWISAAGETPRSLAQNGRMGVAGDDRAIIRLPRRFGSKK